jgi:hypothetical protein
VQYPGADLPGTRPAQPVETELNGSPLVDRSLDNPQITAGGRLRQDLSAIDDVSESDGAMIIHEVNTVDLAEVHETAELVDVSDTSEAKRGNSPSQRRCLPLWWSRRRVRGSSLHRLFS